MERSGKEVPTDHCRIRKTGFNQSRVGETPEPVQPEIAYRKCRQMDVNNGNAADANHQLLTNDWQSQLLSDRNINTGPGRPRVHRGGVVGAGAWALKTNRDIYGRTLGLKLGGRVTAALNGSAQALDRRA